MPRRRRRLHCYLCKQAGPCIQCSDDCDTSFHPLCNLLADAFMRIYDDYQTNSLDFAHYCLKHSPLFLIRNVDIPNSYTKLYRVLFIAISPCDVIYHARARLPFYVAKACEYLPTCMCIPLTLCACFLAQTGSRQSERAASAVRKERVEKASVDGVDVPIHGK